ncbi:MAG: hypothetical protein COW48_03855 [Hydrogenophilales bacterium CG17_big_fil_post_rev_8_21_14_2_50_63_12]|nr:MAG: hypothetical protein COW48_03855 [Hydrogenophilales bacterium CG17_big_fil_post_rev_8_21_14_2_50_63_12]PIX95868.1 MAG: hypothetical protein COZ24_13505 [Hydrogenophilales bacterium CG_4_10_14_3_um_filter_63_21]PJB07919.1 MAG: hypothetical protein CO126_00080 [Hydrogenophilales bacterium CG_4_9_14_3_um_filter_63_34]
MSGGASSTTELGADAVGSGLFRVGLGTGWAITFTATIGVEGSARVVTTGLGGSTRKMSPARMRPGSARWFQDARSKKSWPCSKAIL